MTNARMPAACACSSEIWLLNPVHKIMGISARMRRNSCASSYPVKYGMVKSVITASKLCGSAVNVFSASGLLVLLTTLVTPLLLRYAFPRSIPTRLPTQSAVTMKER